MLEATGDRANVAGPIANSAATVVSAFLKGRSAYLYLLPALFILAAFVALPIVEAIIMSFQRVALTGERDFVGFQNYRLLFGQTRFLNNLQYSFIYLVGNLALSSYLRDDCDEAGERTPGVKPTGDEYAAADSHPLENGSREIGVLPSAVGYAFKVYRAIGYAGFDHVIANVLTVPRPGNKDPWRRSGVVECGCLSCSAGRVSTQNDDNVRPRNGGSDDKQSRKGKHRQTS